MDGMDPKIKSDNHPLLIPNIPFFQYSIIPWVLWRQTPPLSPSCRLYEPETGVKSKPEPLGQDSLLRPLKKISLKNMLELWIKIPCWKYRPKLFCAGA
jgi:hypothetical protein